MASLFARINDIMNSNINDLLDRIEDPERMIKQIIREMEENIVQAREGVLNAITSEKQLLRELEQQRAQSKAWLQKAETALIADKEELARSALARKKDIDAIIANLEPAWLGAKNTSERLKNQLRQLEERLEEAKRKRTTLMARQHAATAHQQMDKTLRTFETGLDAQAKFGRMEDRVAAMEARTAAIAELSEDRSPLEKEFERMELEQDVDAELLALKIKIKK